jgi:hypothetical protein
MIEFDIIIKLGKNETVNKKTVSFSPLGALMKLESQNPKLFNDSFVTEIIIRVNEKKI